MRLTTIELAALRAADLGTLQRCRIPGSSAGGYALRPPTTADECHQARTVFRLERLGFLAMPDSLSASITDAGREALRSSRAPRAAA